MPHVVTVATGPEDEIVEVDDVVGGGGLGLSQTLFAHAKVPQHAFPAHLPY